MADTPLLAAGGDDAPLSYLVPGATSIRLKQAHVSYVDNGAGGDWLPAIRIVSDSNHTMGVAADQGVKVTAGSDADVSFFPGVKPAAAAASSPSLPGCFLVASGFTLNQWTPNVYTAVTWASIVGNDTATFAWPGSGGNTTVALLRSGLYRCVYEWQVTGFNFPVAPGYILSKVTYANIGGALTEELSVNHTTAELYEGNPNVGTKWSPPGERVFNATNPGDLHIDMANTRVGAVTISSMVMFIYRLGDRLV